MSLAEDEDEREGGADPLAHVDEGGDQQNVGATPMSSMVISQRSKVNGTIPEGYESSKLHLEAFKTLTAACAIAQVDSSQLASGTRPSFPSGRVT